MTVTAINRRLDEWKQKLIDPSRRNRLIYFKPSRSTTLLVSKPDAETVFHRLVLQEKPWKFWMPTEEQDNRVQFQKSLFLNEPNQKESIPFPGDEKGELTAARIIPPKQDELVCGGIARTSLERILKNISRKANTDYNERGVRILYLAFGTLIWKDKETADEICSPLILVPIDLERETTKDPYELLLAEEDVILNPALQAKLSNDFKLKLPEIPDDWEEKSLSKYFEEVAQKIGSTGWRIESSVTIGLFSFHKLTMYQDLLVNAEMVKSHPVICAIAGEPLANFPVLTEPVNERQLDTIQKPEETYQILDADSSQQQCIQAALRAQNLVLQGPPGTGKSQTIANIIAEFIARGKTVLFVSEKMAALEVVSKRLRDVYLGEFALELHSHKANKREVVAELKRCLDEKLVPQLLPVAADFEKLKQLRQSLNDYVLALHLIRDPLGESVRDVLTRLAELNSIPLYPTRLTQAERLRPHRIAEWQDLVSRLVTVWHVIEEGEDFPWLLCRETNFNLETRTYWLSLFSEFISAVEDLKSTAAEYASDLGVDAPLIPDDVVWLNEVGQHLNQGPGVDASWLTTSDLEELFKEAEYYQKLCEQYLCLRTEMEQYYWEGFFNLPSGLEGRLEMAKVNAAPLLASDVFGDRKIIDSGVRFLDFLNSTQQSIDDWHRDVSELRSRFGLPEEKVDLKRAHQIARLGVLCDTGAKPEALWLMPQQLPQVKEIVQRIRPEYEDYRARSLELLARYDESLFELDLDRIIEDSNQYAQQPLIGSLDGITRVVEEVLSKRVDKRGRLAGLATLLKQLKEDINKLGTLLGYSVEGLTLERIREIGRLAILCGTENRPDASWLDPVRLQKLKQVIRKVRPEYESYNKARNEVLSCYDESIFDLDLDQLIERFNSLFHRLPFCLLNPKYFRDKKAILRTSQSRSLRATFTDDLLKAREVLRICKRLEPERSEVMALLGEYDQGYGTDFDSVLEAAEVASEILRLSGTASVPTGLINAISFGTLPQPQIIASGKRVLDSIQQCEEFILNLPAVISLDDLVEARALLRIRNRLDTQRDQVKALLGRYHNGYNTNFDLVESAIKIAEEIIALTGALPIPDSLSRLLTQPSPDAHRLVTLGARTIETLQKWDELAQEMSGFFPSALPTTTLPLTQSPLVEIRHWAQSLHAPLHELCTLAQQVLAHHKAPDTLLFPTLKKGFEKNEELIKMQTLLDNEAEQLKQTFGWRFDGMSTEWKRILAAMEWTRKLRELFGTRPLSEKLIKWSSQPGIDTPPVETLVARYESYAKHLSDLEASFDAPEPKFGGSPLRKLPLGMLFSRLVEMRERIDDLQAWTDYKRLAEQFEKTSLSEFLKQLHKNPPPANELVRVFQKSVYQAWANAMIEQDPRLKEFRSRHHEQLIEEFREVDWKLVRLAPQQVIRECNERRPQTVYLQAQDSEVSILRREAAKKRKHLPVRHLFDRTPNLLLKLKPCLLMSPLSVSQFLSPERFKFDLVIFDEASQIFTEDAIGAIYRGSQLVVAGDSKQLPPTDFFKSIESDSEEADESIAEQESSADFNSVLDECESVPGMSVYSLRWHYRSRHESLIAFSNHRFYSNRLVTFPSAQHQHPLLGVEFVYLSDGVYDRGGKRINQREAEKVADRVFDHFAKYPQKSIGVVAFSQAQMTAIEDEIERRRSANSAFEQFFKEDRLEGFFVKNLENVQGDERDVIIFSIGYGRDQQGRMSMAFGPINRVGGERRLNVAITRAREKVILVSSIKASNFDLSATQSAGVLNLYHYLDFAERGAEALQLSAPQGQGEIESPFEADVIGEIRAMGYNVVPQVGCSGYRIDIGVVDPSEPGRFLLGVECDGATYHSAATARDRDRLRQQVLERLGWHIHRVWSPDWITTRDTEIKRLRQAIEDARQCPAKDDELVSLVKDEAFDPFKEEQKVERVLVEQPDCNTALPGTIPYKIHEVKSSFLHAGEFHDSIFHDARVKLLNDVVCTEGPIHFDLATRRVISGWGIARAGVRVVTAMKEAVKICEKKLLLKQKGDFLWPAGISEVPVRIPVNHLPESYRAIDHIPSEEVQACLLLIIEHAVGIGVEALIKETGNVFGFNRTGDRIRERLLKEINVLEREGSLTNTEGSLSFNSSITLKLR